MKWLAYRTNVKKTPAIVRTVDLLDSYFEGEASEISSGLRTPQDQLNIIIQKAFRWKIREEYPEVSENIEASPERTVHIAELNRDLFWWQRLWSKLLNIGDIVNPPLAAEALFDYFRPGSSENRKGKVIQLSPHQHGLAFDIAGNMNLVEKAKRVLKAYQVGDCFLKGYLVEHVNNAIHCDCVQIGD